MNKKKITQILVFTSRLVLSSSGTWDKWSGILKDTCTIHVTSVTGVFGSAYYLDILSWTRLQSYISTLLNHLYDLFYTFLQTPRILFYNQPNDIKLLTYLFIYYDISYCYIYRILCTNYVRRLRLSGWGRRGWFRTAKEHL